MLPSIDFSDVSVYYGNHLALDRISLSLPSGSLWAVSGPNGGGKSSFAKLLSLSISPSSGKISGLKKQSISYLPQNTDIDRSFPLSVFDTVGMGLWGSIGGFKGTTPDQQDLIWKALEDARLTQHAHRTLDTLSGGQLQKALFARVSLQDASLILLDEPFNNLDHPTIEELMVLLKKWHTSGKTVIVVLHDLELIKKHFPQTMLFSKKLMALGTTSQVLTPELLAESYTRSQDILWEAFK